MCTNGFYTQFFSQARMRICFGVRQLHGSLVPQIGFAESATAASYLLHPLPMRNLCVRQLVWQLLSNKLSVVRAVKTMRQQSVA